MAVKSAATSVAAITPVVVPGVEETGATTPASAWAAPSLLARAAMGTAAIGFGMAFLSTWAAVQFITVPGRLARRLF
jgi:hypothetical protein